MAKSLGRLLDTMQTYYVLAYQPPPHEKQGFKKAGMEHVSIKGEETQGLDLTLAAGEVARSSRLTRYLNSSLIDASFRARVMPDLPRSAK